MKLGDGSDNYETVNLDHSNDDYGSDKGRSTDRPTNGKIQAKSFRREAIKLLRVIGWSAGL